MKSIYLIITNLIFAFNIYAQIDITSGGSGVAVPGQSFNETRGTEVKANENITIHSVTLHHFNTGRDSAFVGLRIYDSATGSIIHTQDRVIGAGNDVSVSFSTAFDFQQSKSYRISFYAYGFGNNNSSGSFTGYKPNFPYTESEGMLLVNGAYSLGTDAFPINSNLFSPYFTMKYSRLSTPPSPPCTQCNCKLIYALLILIILLLLFMIRKCCKK